MHYVEPKENFMRATKAELLGKIDELKKQINDYKGDLVERGQTIRQLQDECHSAHQDHERVTGEIKSVREQADKIKADLASVKAEVDARSAENKRIESERKRERLLAKVVKKERDLYRSILRAIAWELDQPGMKDRNPWSMSWAPLLYGAALAGPAIWYMLKAGKKSRKTGEDVAKQGVQEAAAQDLQQKAAKAALASVFGGKGS